MRQYPHRRVLDLKSTIAIFTVALFVSTIWVLAHDMGQKVRDNFKTVLAAQQFQTVQHVSNSLDEAIRIRIGALTDAAALIDPGLMARPASLHGFLAQQKPLERFFNTGIFVISRDGVGYADLPYLEGREGGSYREADFYRDVMATGKPVVGKPIVGRIPNQSVIHIAVPIKNAKNEIIGVLAGGNQIVGSDLLTEVLPSKLKMEGDLHVISLKDGLFVGSTDPGYVLKPEPAAGSNTMYDRYKQGYEGSGVEVNAQGIESLISAQRVASTGWLVLATQPTSSAFAKIEAVRQDLYKDAGLASVAIVLLLWLFLGSQLSPLGRSARTIDAMTAGHEALRPLPVEGSKEIRLLLESFNQLQGNINQQQQALVTRDEQLRIAASVFEGTSEGILITSPANLIVSVNRAFCKMTGYAEYELIGQNPKILRSGRHSLGFYKEMWATLKIVGQWQGEVWNRRKNGEIYPERLSISTLYDDAGQVLRHIAIAADITARKKTEDEINSLAFYDPLTDLPNRRLLLDRLRQALAASARNGQYGALLFIDLDNFKTINDSLGHDIGDLLLQEVAHRLICCVREGDTVARLGGDEFVVMLEDLDEDAVVAATQTETVGEKILATLNEPYQLAGNRHHSSPSIGVTLFADHQFTLDELMKRADLAMYQAKAAGRNNLRFFDPQMQAVVMGRAAMEADLREAVAKDQFLLYYQPQVDGEIRVKGAEALLRWQHPERGLVAPGEFIDLAEDTGLILPIGLWVLKSACAQLAAWAAQPEMADLTVAVNVSVRQFHLPDFVDQLLAVLRETGADPLKLKLELTESLLVSNVEDVIAKMSQLKAIGVRFSLDDFGTGYSSLSYLSRLPLDQLKIDRSFVMNIEASEGDAVICAATINLAHSLKLKVVAEGVETEAQQHFLETIHGCDILQGYLFSRPLPCGEFETFALRSQEILARKLILFTPQGDNAPTNPGAYFVLVFSAPEC